MSADTESVDWRQLREFASVDLAQSYVLSWHLEADSLVADIDVHLTPEHPFYEKPRPAEKHCIRPAVIEFPYCDQIAEDGQQKAASLSEAVAALRNGRIEELRARDGEYEIRGEFGTVRVLAERPLLRLKSG
ncbi:MAG: hypothetical protein WBN09_12400 [Woeseiaceae bacterium]